MMKKVIALMLVLLMVFSLAACKNNKPDNTEPPVDSELLNPGEGEVIEQPELEEPFKVVFSNDKVTFTLTKISLDKVTRNIYKDLSASSENAPAVLDEVVLEFFDKNPKPPVVYNPEDQLVTIPEKPIRLVLKDLNYNLLGTEDLCFVYNANPVNAKTVFEAFPGEMLRELRNREYTDCYLRVTGKYHLGEGENAVAQRIEFEAKTTFEENFDTSALTKVPVVVTETGAKVSLKYSELMEAMGLQSGTKATLNFIDVLSSTNETYLTYEEAKELTSATETLEFEYTYENAAELNRQFAQEIKDGNYAYVCVSLTVKTDDGEQEVHVYLLADANTDAIQLEEDAPAVPDEPTEPPVDEPADEPEDEASEPDGGNEE